MTKLKRQRGVKHEACRCHGMGIVSSIVTTARRCLPPCGRKKSGLGTAEDYAERGFRCQVHGKPKLEWGAIIHRKVRRFMRSGAAGITSPCAGDRRCWLGEKTSQRAHRDHHGLRPPLRARHRPGRRHHARERAPQGRAFRSAQGHVTGTRRPSPPFQDQGIITRSLPRAPHRRIASATQRK